MSMSECQLKIHNGCCCKCKHHKTDYYHCTTAVQLRTHLKKCICNIPKGYICMFDPDHYFSNWTNHGMCESFYPKEEKKIEEE